MSVEEKINVLYEQLNLAASEYNLKEVEELVKELRSLGDENEGFDDIISKIRYSKYPEDVEEFEDDMDIAIFTGDDLPMAERFLEKYKIDHPYCLAVSYWSLYLDKFYYERVYSEEYHLTKTNSMRDIVCKAARNFYLKEGDYNTAYTMFVSADDYESAREVIYKCGKELLSNKDYTRAQICFQKARGYKDSLELVNNLQIADSQYKKFKNDIPDDYIIKKVKSEYPDLVSKFRKACLKTDNYVDNPGFFCLLCFLISFAITILMHGDPELNNYICYIIFTITTTIGVHKLFDLDYGKFSVISIGAVSLCGPKLLQLGSVKLFETGVPAFVLLNIILIAAVVYCLVQEIRAASSKSAEKKAVKLRKKLGSKVVLIKENLINQYSSGVDRTVVRQWVDELKTLGLYD